MGGHWCYTADPCNLASREIVQKGMQKVCAKKKDVQGKGGAKKVYAKKGYAKKMGCKERVCKERVCKERYVCRHIVHRVLASHCAWSFVFILSRVVRRGS